MLKQNVLGVCEDSEFKGLIVRKCSYLSTIFANVMKSWLTTFSGQSLHILYIFWVN
jgi:hypothetical protein